MCARIDVFPCQVAHGFSFLLGHLIRSLITMHLQTLKRVHLYEILGDSTIFFTMHARYILVERVLGMQHGYIECCEYAQIFTCPTDINYINVLN